jgi:tryptophan-rich sensory protein
MFWNTNAYKFSNNTLGQISAENNLQIKPKAWVIGLMWAVIYFLVAVFIIYQALPKKYTPARNDDLIFNQIKYVFAINMILNGSWLPVFLLNTKVSFIFALIIISGLLMTNIYIM